MYYFYKYKQMTLSLWTVGLTLGRKAVILLHSGVAQGVWGSLHRKRISIQMSADSKKNWSAFWKLGPNENCCVTLNMLCTWSDALASQYKAVQWYKKVATPERHERFQIMKTTNCYFMLGSRSISVRERGRRGNSTLEMYKWEGIQKILANLLQNSGYIFYNLP